MTPDTPDIPSTPGASGTPAAAGPAPAVVVDAVEVTQAVQDLNHSVPLVAGKATVVRVYLSRPAAPGLTVRGEITVRRSPADTPSTVSSLGTVFLDPAQAGKVAVCRNDADLSLNFRLPDARTTPGQLTVDVTTVVDTATGQAVPLSGSTSLTVWFQASPPLRVRILGLRYRFGTPPAVHTPRALDFAALLSWLRRAYPVDQVISSAAVVDVSADEAAEFSCGDVNAQLAALRALDISAGADLRTHYYGLVADDGFYMRGCASGIPAVPDPATVASGPAGAADFGWDFDGTYGDWYGAHELGHTFGRRHPGFCGETPDDLPNYPFAQGCIADATHQFVGFDVGDPALGLPMAALPGLQWHDVMTYCDFQWLSPYTYQGVRNRLIAEDALGPPAPGPTGGSGGHGGRPDERFPARAVLPQGPEREASATTEGGAPGPDEPHFVSVVARVNLTRGQGGIRFVNPVAPRTASAAGPEPDTGTPALLRVHEAGRATPRDIPVHVKLDSELGPEDDSTGLIDAVVPVGPGTQAIDLVIDGRTVDTFRASAPPPVLRATRHAGTEDGAMGLALEFDRELAPDTSYAAQVSTDQGATWQTIAVGMRDPVIHVDRGQFRPGDEVQVRIITTNGFTSTSAITESFRV